MILTVDESDVDYSELVKLVDLVIVDGTPIKNCVYVDTISGKYIVHTQPLQVVKGELVTETKHSNNIEVTFKGSPQVVNYYLNEINN